MARTPAGLRLSLAASAAGLAAAQPVLRAFLDEAGLAPAVADRAELLVEEVVMNVHMHGFEDPAAAEVDLHAAVDPAGCTLVFEDAGRAFDPTQGELAERPTQLAEAEPGGLGLVLLRRMATGLDYERLAAGRNRLTVLLGAPAATGPASP
jgi:anti-sigma regulatory factor (Ser/Thr protein kinase)